jgi:hypothetical protein
VILALIFLLLGDCVAGYGSFQKNLDGSYVCGGAYDSFKKNP